MLPMELPPRARRILRNGLLGPAPSGTTSACAENTATILEPTRPTRNYLRVRGEYPSKVPRSAAAMELPPRARRIRTAQMGFLRARGTTSACAENTHLHPCRCAAMGNYLRVRGEYPSVPVLQRLHWNYLRVRGEYNAHNLINNQLRELPPRARRIPSWWLVFGGLGGTTSACAENTAPRVVPGSAWWNYLRVRGEYMLLVD